MNEETHTCSGQGERTVYNEIFYSPLWKSWALKIMNEGVKAGVLQPVLIEINNCPYCGKDLNDPNKVLKTMENQSVRNLLYRIVEITLIAALEGTSANSPRVLDLQNPADYSLITDFEVNFIRLRDMFQFINTVDRSLLPKFVLDGVDQVIAKINSLYNSV